MKTVKILIADDHDLIREGLKSLLEPEPSITIIAEAINGEEVLAQIKQLPELDIILMDINMPVMDGIDTTLKIKENYPEIGIIVLTMYNRKEFVKNLIASGADGYVLKNSGKKVLMEAINCVAGGEPYYEKEITRTIMSTFKKPLSYRTNVDVELTEREKDVIRLIVRGKSTEEIAEQLFISKHTVDTHRKHILAKLEVKNVAGIIRYAFQTGLVKDYDLL